MIRDIVDMTVRSSFRTENEADLIIQITVFRNFINYLILAITSLVAVALQFLPFTTFQFKRYTDFIQSKLDKPGNKTTAAVEATDHDARLEAAEKIQKEQQQKIEKLEAMVRDMQVYHKMKREKDLHKVSFPLGRNSSGLGHELIFGKTEEVMEKLQTEILVLDGQVKDKLVLSDKNFKRLKRELQRVSELLEYHSDGVDAARDRQNEALNDILSVISSSLTLLWDYNPSRCEPFPTVSLKLMEYQKTMRIIEESKNVLDLGPADK